MNKIPEIHIFFSLDFQVAQVDRELGLLGDEREAKSRKLNQKRVQHVSTLQQLGMNICDCTFLMIAVKIGNLLANRVTLFPGQLFVYILKSMEKNHSNLHFNLPESRRR